MSSGAFANQTQPLSARNRLLLLIECAIAAILSPIGCVFAIATLVILIVVILKFRGKEVFLPPLPSSHRSFWQGVWEGLSDFYIAMLLAWFVIGMLLAVISIVGCVLQVVWHPFGIGAILLFVFAVFSFVTAAFAGLTDLALATGEEKMGWK